MVFAPAHVPGIRRQNCNGDALVLTGGISPAECIDLGGTPYVSASLSCSDQQKPDCKSALSPYMYPVDAYMEIDS
jgi:hypothetical protein